MALTHKIDLNSCFDYVIEAKKAGLTVPVIMMGYYNPIVAYGEDKFIQKAKTSGVAGFIVVDLPAESSLDFVKKVVAAELAFIPLIAPTTPLERIQKVASLGNAFVYVISSMGVTGTRATVNTHLKQWVDQIRTVTDSPLAVGFGVSTPEQFDEIGQYSDAVVIGSKIITVLKEASKILLKIDS